MERDALRLCPNVIVFDTSTGPNLIRSDVFDASWLRSICQRDISNISSASDAKLRVSGIITLHRQMDESRTRLNFGNISELAVTVRVQTDYVDRFIKSMHPFKRKIVPFHSPPLSILMMHEAWSVAENEK